VDSITGDEEVIVVWYPNSEWDLSGYRVYRNNRPEGAYDRIAWVPAGRSEYADRDVENGVTYYYAVSAVDNNANESDLSSGLVDDTPRPEGRDLRLHNYYSDPEHQRCAYDFSLFQVTDYDDPDADIAYVDDGTNGAWMFGLEDPPGSGVFTELQDAGFLGMDDLSVAPPEGWSPRAAVELIEGHTYAVWTRDDNYAKFRVVELHSTDVVIDWAYQVDPGNQELREVVPVATLQVQIPAAPARDCGGGSRSAVAGVPGAVVGR